MKKFFLFVIVAGMLILFLKNQDEIINVILNMFVQQEAAPTGETIAALDDINKNVRLKRANSTFWNMAEIREKLALMDSVSTGYDSNAVIKFNTGYFFKLGENSLIVIDEPGAELANLIVLSLDQGIIQGKNTEKEDAVVQIKTGEATTELKGRASFGIRVNKDKSAEVWVQKGSARITKKSGEVLEIEENEHKQFATLGEGLHDTKYIFKDYGTKVKTPAGEYQFAQSGSQRDELADGLSRSVINKYITKNRKKIDICYHKRGNEFRGGKIVVRLVIEKTGGVISASVTSSTLNNTTIENCVLFWIKAIKFPPFKGEAVAETITYVFE